MSVCIIKKPHSLYSECGFCYYDIYISEFQQKPDADQGLDLHGG